VKGPTDVWRIGYTPVMHFALVVLGIVVVFVVIDAITHLERSPRVAGDPLATTQKIVVDLGKRGPDD